LRIEHVDEAKPVAARDSLLIYVNQFIKIVAKAQADAKLPCGLITLQDKAGEQASRAVLNGQRIREAEVVLGNDVWVDQSHRETPW
jgi:hypothetical protein